MCLKVKYERENAVKRKMKELWGFGSKSLDKLQCDLNKHCISRPQFFFI